MKKFQFPLQSVLDVRSLRKRMAERDVAATRAELERNGEDLDRVREAYRGSFHHDLASGSHPAFSIDVVMRYREGLIARERKLLERRQKLTEELEAQVQTLTRRTKDEMVIAKLEEQQRREHRRQAEHAEQAEIEEIDILKRGLES